MNVTETPPVGESARTEVAHGSTLYAGGRRWRKSFSYAFPFPKGHIRFMKLVGRDYRNQCAHVKITDRIWLNPLGRPIAMTGHAL